MTTWAAGFRKLRWIILLVLLLAAPIIAGDNRFFAFVVGITLIYVLWTAGMNLLYGYTGLLPLVFAGVAGVSAYGTVALVMKAGWSFWLATPLCAVAAAILGVLLGLPSLRLKGFYFALSTLVIQTAISLAFVFFTDLTNGDTGISSIPPPDNPFGKGAITGVAGELMLALFAWAGVVGSAAIASSSFGKKLVAIREDEILAETLGIDIVRCKLVSFFIGSVYAAVGGSLYATYIGFISPRSFDVHASVNVWLMVTFGGRGTIVGPIIGTLVLAPLQYFLQEYDTLKDVIYGVLIILVTVAMPVGIYGEIRRHAVKYLSARKNESKQTAKTAP